MIKLARSSFAAPDRVEAWGKLTCQYRNAGVYCRLFLPVKDSGNFHTCLHMDDLSFVAWAEEHKAYRTLKEVLDELKAKRLSDEEQAVRARLEGDEWIKQLGTHVGRACTVSFNGIKPDFPSAYVIYRRCSSRRDFADIPVQTCPNDRNSNPSIVSSQTPFEQPNPAPIIRVFAAGSGSFPTEVS